MGSFSTTALKVSTSDGHNIVLLEAFTYTANDGTVYTIPAGTTSDGASTPPVLWPTIPPFGAYWMAAVCHDHWYRDTELPKDLCDDLLREAMLTLGVPHFEAETIYEGVHLAGWASFDGDRKAQPVSTAAP